MFSEYIKKRAVRKYIYEMAPALVKGYGPQDQFTVPQIEAAAKKCRLNMQFIPYAIALYRHEESNRTLRLYRLNQEFINILRREISEWFFDGYDFRTKDVFRMAKPRAWRGGHMQSSANRLGVGATH